jgi:hypothetical protein
MKNPIYKIFSCLLSVLLLLCLTAGSLSAQDEAAAPTKKAVKNTFESNLIMDNQSVMVPIKGTFEMAIQHRFGTVKNGFDDLWGIYAPSNIRLGFNYAPISKLFLGFGLTKEHMFWDFNAKYAILQQMKEGGSPVSLTYYGNFGVDGRDKKYFYKGADRMSYFHQLIIARKFGDKLGLQLAPSISYFNNVEGYLDENGDIQGKMKHAHIAISGAGRYKITEKLAITVGFDQPITAHPLNNPYPNVNFGLDITTSSHSFQVFAGNYSSIVPQRNNVFNQNDYQNSGFLIGFNITRLWNW